MKYRLTLLLSLCLFGGFLSAPACAQTKEELALEIARETVPDQFRALKPLMDGFMDNLRKQNQSNKKSDRLLEIWVEEIKSSFNPESLTKIVADTWAKELTLAELQQVQVILRSPVFKRLNEVSELMGKPQTLAPMFHEACERAEVRGRTIGLGTIELETICKAFAPPPRI